VSEAPLPARAVSLTGAGAATPAAAAPLVDPDLVEAARILRGVLVRVHPSFRFEERLATQLEAAATLARGRASAETDRASVGSEPLLFPLSGMVDVEADVFPPRGGPERDWHVPSLPVGLGTHVPRGALIGGAIASGVSLAGAAIIARRWRRRPSRSPFARAARAAHRSGNGRARVTRGGIA